MAKDTEQSKEGPGNDRILGSATGKRGIKCLEPKTIEQKHIAIMEVEKGHK